MTTLEQAARQALEALENAPIEYDFRGNPMDVEFGIQLDNAVEALRQALEQQPKQEPKFCTHNVEQPHDWSEWVCPKPKVFAVFENNKLHIGTQSLHRPVALILANV